ncbi:MAG: DEAD/DEAH box helicase [Candidatus Sumerlaeia bacterium]|nr:DEAD/DEAH box helicase [Candidatus Sumerlaeia bacterium]
MAKTKGKFSVDELITPEAQSEIRAVIEDCGGNEVFFLGRLDKDQRICEIEPLAFGSEESVPAIKGTARSGDVVLHNHPSGGISPSSADISIAAELAEQNIGSYIVNNEVTAIYVIFRPVPAKEYVLLDYKEIGEYFTVNGKLAQVQAEFEFRPQQVSMAKTVARAFNENKICAIEAGTGVGKSFAYLVPAILWAINNKERVIVSTHTINLQEQLVFKDLPFLRDKLKLKFTSALTKGRNNYICLRKVNLYRQEPKIFENKEEEAEAKALIAWAQKSEDGSLSDLNVKPSPEVWEQFVSEADNCQRIKCSYYAQCPFYRARRKAAQVDIIVANHHLMMADIALRDSTQNYNSATVLPPYSRLIFDEAHNLEEVAISYFGIQVTHFGINKLLGRLVTKRHKERGILPVLAKKIFAYYQESSSQAIKEALDIIKNELIPDLHQLQEEIDGAMERIRRAVKEYVSSQGEVETDEGSIKLRITERLRNDSLWTDVIQPNLARTSGALIKFSLALRKLCKKIYESQLKEKSEIGELILDVNAKSNRIDEICSKINLFCTARKDICYWVELSKSKFRRSEPGPLRFCAAPINVGESLKRAIFEKIKTVIMTSATLTVDNKFDYFLRQIGLEKNDTLAERELQDSNLSEEEIKDVKELHKTDNLILLQLDTPFHFEEQAFVGVPRDFPDPTEPDYPVALERFIYEAIKIAGGGTLVLFTSYNLMDNLFSRLENAIADLGIQCMKQGEAPRHKLLTQFREDIGSVLFATASFWEGIDVKGEALRCLILTRLPFRVPSEPIMAAKAEYLEYQGRDPFLELELPFAVMKFRQGFGRLIRSRTDRGAVLITDRRVITRFYGKVFLRSLPTKKIQVSPESEILNYLKLFFARG